MCIVLKNQCTPGTYRYIRSTSDFQTYPFWVRTLFKIVYKINLNQNIKHMFITQKFIIEYLYTFIHNYTKLTGN